MNETAKLNKVKNENKKLDIMESEDIHKSVRRLATEVSNKVVNVTVREALMTSDYTKELLNATIRKAARCTELQRKYPSLPDKIQKLSEPTTATYIALYNKHRNVLKPKTVGSVKEKIAEYLDKIEEISIKEKLEKNVKMEKRKKRKSEAMKKQKQNEFTNFCIDKCDEIFQIFLDKITESLKKQREIPKPLIMGPSSLKMYRHIQDQMKKLLSSNRRMKINEIVGTTETSVMGTDETKEIAETKEIIDTLSYFLMEFVQNSLVEAV